MSTKCQCGVRAANECPGAWEPGCDLGANPDHAVAVAPLPEPPLIGLTGLARSGKDTVAAHLVQRHGFVQHSFAGPIRTFVANILGWSRDELEGGKEEPIPWLNGQTPRRLMQTVGTEWGRQMIHPHLWVESCLRRVHWSRRVERRPVVISDVRFDNEAEAIRAAGGQVWMLVRARAGIAGSHVSEAGVRTDLVDRVIPNNASVEMLHAALDANVQAVR